ncbi:MAG: DUF4118 domain-containing protein [Acidobacteria bacterium]|nr:DUF4118 domain-containing protein [Acidobacteriota bacterium]
MIRSIARGAAAFGAVVVITVIAKTVLPVNAATVGFTYILLVLNLATFWGFREACIASLAATFSYNFFFLPPVGTLTIADPENWVALFSLLLTSMIASQLSAKVKRRAAEALERQADLESLYTFSRSILLIEGGEPFARQLARALAEVFRFEAVVLFDRRSGEFFRAGPADFDGLEDQLREAALHGSSFTDATGRRVITAIRLGMDPIASIAMEGDRKQDSVTQGIANLVAIGLERARAQELGHEMEAARRSEQLRTTLIDAMAHEFKTPLTSIKAATTALLADRGQPSEELLRMADEEADHLRELIDDAVDTARLESAHIDLERQYSDAAQLVREVLSSMRSELEGRQVVMEERGDTRLEADARLVKLAFKQIAENARKYSPASEAIRVAVEGEEEAVVISVRDSGPGIAQADQDKIFDRFYRAEHWRESLPGSGLGLSIARTIVRAHGGDITLDSRPGDTVFRMRFPRS